MAGAVAVGAVLAHGDAVRMQHTALVARGLVHVAFDEYVLSDQPPRFTDIELFRQVAVAGELVAAEAILQRLVTVACRHRGIVLEKIQQAEVVAHMLGEDARSRCRITIRPAMVGTGHRQPGGGVRDIVDVELAVRQLWELRLVDTGVAPRLLGEHRFERIFLQQRQDAGEILAAVTGRFRDGDAVVGSVGEGQAEVVGLELGIRLFVRQRFTELRTTFATDAPEFPRQRHQVAFIGGIDVDRGFDRDGLLLRTERGDGA